MFPGFLRSRTTPHDDTDPSNRPIRLNVNSKIAYVLNAKTDPF